jgi:retinol dehydrogenase-12
MTWDYKDMPDLTGKVALVTGASTGLGKQTCLELARKGAHVFALGRSEAKTKAAIEEIKKETGSDKVEMILGDLMSLESVDEAAKTFLARKLPLHILVNNVSQNIL